MGRTVAAISIFVLIIGLAVFESIFTINISEQVKAELNDALTAYNHSDTKSAETHLNKADKIWGDNTWILDAFLIHDNTEDIAGKISTAKNTLKYNKKCFPIECSSAIESLDIVIYTMLPFFDNVL